VVPAAEGMRSSMRAVHRSQRALPRGGDYREKAYRLLGDELPYDRVHRSLEEAEGGARIAATLVVEREAHKGIVSARRAPSCGRSLAWRGLTSGDARQAVH